ncbi:MAG: hypothetical protein L3J79_07175 [Candidatus Marinimicrobia bacterium]|nr:hypothetical protein [Candidatus Neomarinimicrobiota bacterium]
MLRSEIENSVNNLIATIEECELVEIFAGIQKNEGELNTEAALNSFRKFQEISQLYNTFEHQLLEMFDLEKLKDTAFWATMLSRDDSSSRKSVKEVFVSLKLVVDFLPKILTLTKTDDDKISLAIEEGEKEGLEYVGLSVVVIEEQNLSSPKQLILMLEAIQGLYEVVGGIKNLPVQDLLVTSCDSGNDKKFDFLGSSKVIEGVKSIILSLWDRVVFHRGDKTGKHLELLTQSLPILAEITDLEKSGNLEKEEAEIIKRQAVASVTTFSQDG